MHRGAANIQWGAGAADLKKSIAKIGGEKGKGKADREERVSTSGELTSGLGALPYAIVFHSRRRFRDLDRERGPRAIGRLQIAGNLPDRANENTGVQSSGFGRDQ